MRSPAPPQVFKRSLRSFLVLIIFAINADSALAKTTHFKYNATGSLGSPWVGLVPYAPEDSPPAPKTSLWAIATNTTPGWIVPRVGVPGPVRHAPTGLCIQAADSAAQNSVVGVATCRAGLRSQEFVLEPDGNLHLKQPASMCLAMQHFEGPEVVLWECNTGENEEFVFAGGSLCSKGDASHQARCLYVGKNVPHQNGGGGPGGSFPHSMENFYVSMASLMAGWSNFTFAAFEKKLDGIASRMNQGICRVYLDYPGKTHNKTDGVPAFLVPGLKFAYYGSKKCVDGTTSTGCNLSPDWSNTTLRKAMTALISEMGKRYDGDKRIAFWQVGFLGQWGEWHDPGNAQGGPQWASKDVQTEILHAFNSSFLTTPLLVRYPDVIGNYTPADIRIGFHDDSYAQDTIGNTSWNNNSWHFLTKLVRANATDRWQHVPIGGELRPELQKCIFNADLDSCKVGGLRAQDFNTCTNITHASWQWDDKMSLYTDTNGDLTRAKAAAAAMGYRLYVSQVGVTTSTSSSDSTSLTVSVSIQNTGVAPCYYPASLLLTYPCSTNKNCTKTFGPDLRTLLPSDRSLVADVSVVVPASIMLPSDGQQDSVGATVGVSVDTAHALRPVRFAVDGGDSTGVLWASSK
eukprot:COSAG02_NODE_2356_length_9072_cov_14.450017_4_plen_630_part_00